MDAEAVSAALSPASLAPPIAKDLGLSVDAVQAALELLAAGAQPAFLARYRQERIKGLSIRDLERIQARAARAVAFVFKQQEVDAELTKRKHGADYLKTHLHESVDEVDLDDLRALFRRRKKGPAIKARSAGLTPASERLWRFGSQSVLADVAKAQISIDAARAAQAAGTQEHKAAPQPDASEAPSDVPPVQTTDAVETTEDVATTQEVETTDDVVSTPQVQTDEEPAPSETPESPSPDSPPSEEPPVQAAGAEPAPAEPQTPLPDESSRPEPEPPCFDAAAVAEQIGADAVADEPEAMKLVRIICGEQMADHPPLRRRLRQLVLDKGQLRSRVVEAKKEKAGRYTKYFDRSEAAKGAAAINVLSLHRGEREGLLRVDLEIDPDQVLEIIVDELKIDASSPAGAALQEAAREAWQHGLGKAVKAGVRKRLKQRADREAIGDFCEALRPLLLAPAFGARPVLAIDPGQQNGCRLVVLDAQGAVQAEDTVFPLQPKMQVPQAKARIAELCKQHGVEGITVSTTGPGREVERMCRQVTREDEALSQVAVAAIDGDAAALFASSRVGKDELPKADAATRRAVSLGRRLQDPLMELIKLDVRKLGLGPNQHEVEQEELRSALDQVMVSCVSEVTLDVNRASAEQLAHVAGLSQALAKAMARVREGKGAYRSRADLLDVPGLPGKAFEQCAGFLRVQGGEQPLDATLVHPERYGQVTQMARDLGVTVGDLIGNAELIDKLEPDKYLGTPGLSGEPLGKPSYELIVGQLRNPQADPRPPFETVEFNPDLADFAGLTVGMELEGIVTHLAAFGAFVDVGIAQEGLVHVSELSHDFVSSPLDAVHVGQRVKGRVIEISPDKKRFSLSLKALMPRPERPPRKDKDARGGKKRKKGERGDDRRGKGRDAGKGRGGKRPEKKDRTLGFRMDLSDLAQLLDE